MNHAEMILKISQQEKWHFNLNVCSHNISDVFLERKYFSANPIYGKKTATK